MKLIGLSKTWRYALHLAILMVVMLIPMFMLMQMGFNSKGVAIRFGVFMATFFPLYFLYMHVLVPRWLNHRRYALFFSSLGISMVAWYGVLYLVSMSLGIDKPMALPENLPQRPEAFPGPMMFFVFSLLFCHGHKPGSYL